MKFPILVTHYFKHDVCASSNPYQNTPNKVCIVEHILEMSYLKSGSGMTCPKSFSLDPGVWKHCIQP